MAEELPPFRYVPPVDPNIGRRFGRYIVRKLLGRGGMGAAYLAEHEAQSHVRCVIKFVLAELAQNPMVISRYNTETKAVSLLKHDNIVKLQDFGVLDDSQLFMCFEYINEMNGRIDREHFLPDHDDWCYAYDRDAPNERKYARMSVLMARLAAAVNMRWDSPGQGSTDPNAYVGWARFQFVEGLRGELLNKFSLMVTRLPSPER